jgi:hypothetical protein
MAQTVTIEQGDTITGILKSERGLRTHETHAWISKLRRINPHISSLDRIYPGESILMPDTLHETITERQIWGNAFYKIPPALRHPYCGNSQIYFAQAGDTIDKVAQYMFSSGPHRTMAASTKRALLLHNNPFLKNHLHTNRIPMNRLINITPAKLSEVEREHWQLQRTPLKTLVDRMGKETRDMFKQAGPEPTVTMAQMVEYLRSLGASVGTDDMVRGAGYGLAGVSGHAAAGTMALGNVNALMRQLYEEAVEKFGPKIVYSKKANDLAKMQNFLKGSPKYSQLMSHIHKLPKHLFSKVEIPSVTPRVNSSVARHFRRHVSLPLKKWNNPYKYVGSVAKQLNGRLTLFKYVGKGATWYVPATLGLISAATAPPEMRMRRFFEEGFGVVGGAIGTKAGAAIGGIIALTILGLGPFGFFVTVFIFASLGGISFMEGGKWFGGRIYDIGDSLSGRVYNSMDELVGSLND